MRSIRQEWFNVAPDALYRLYPLGDVHIGAAACDEASFDKLIADIAKDPHAIWLGMGDYIEAINRNDKRFDPETLAPWITVADTKDLIRTQVRYFCHKVAPIAHKCVGVLGGNHEGTASHYTERDILGEIIDSVKQDGDFEEGHRLRLDYAGWLRFAWFKGYDRDGGSRTLDVFAHHGAGSSTKTSGAITKLEQMLHNYEADLLFNGHTHKVGVAKVVTNYLDRGEAQRQRVRYGVISPTYLKSTIETAADGTEYPPTYGEMKAYDPTPTGRAEVEIRPLDDGPDRMKVVYW